MSFLLSLDNSTCSASPGTFIDFNNFFLDQSQILAVSSQEPVAITSPVNPNANGEGLLYDDLEKMFDGIAPRKKLMLIDACHSGELDKEDITMEEANKTDLENKGIKGVSVKVRPSQKAGSANSFELLQHFFANVSRGTGTTVISAAAGTQYALERGDIQNGVFTYSIIEAMNTYPSINVQFLKRYVTSRVVELTNGLQRPNARTETNITDWRVW